MSLESTLERGREAAESRMTDTCRIGREVRDAEPDPVSLDYGRHFEAIYSGVCEFKAAEVQVHEIATGNQDLVEQNFTLKLPILTSTGVRKDMVVIIDSSPTDPGLVGIHGRITGPFASSFTTARRFPVEVTT